MKTRLLSGVVAGLLACASATVGAATIVVVPGAGFADATPRAPEGGNPGTTIGAQRLFAFQAAANAWGAMLSSAQTITVNANFESLECTEFSGQLGSAGPTNFFLITVAGTQRLVPVPLAEAMTGTNLNGASPEIDANFNLALDLESPDCLGGNRWYYGVSGPTPNGTSAFFPTVLHELGHGLGFLTLVCDDPAGCSNGIPFGGYPVISATERLDTWALRMRDTSVNQLWPTMSAAQRSAAFTGETALVWDGPAVAAALPGFSFSGGLNGGRMKMYTPNPIEPGSSLSHFDESAAPNLLMEPVADDDVFSQTDLTGPAFADLGWVVAIAAPGTIFANGFE